jgi:hypothetical protein
VAASGAAAATAVCQSWTSTLPPSPGADDNEFFGVTAWKLVPNPSPGPEPELSGVAAASTTNAWAVGSYLAGSTGKTLILRWNGRAWKQVASPSIGVGSGLQGVAATSASNIWAVGDFVTSNNSALQVRALHCC